MEPKPDYEKLARKYRKRPVLDSAAPSVHSVDIRTEQIQHLLPHRHPFLFVNRITAVDFEQQGISGTWRVDPTDPVFQGHFPDYPILPGVLQIEMIGQHAICYHSLAANRDLETTNNKTPNGIRALKILHTLFQHEVLPGDELEVVARVLDQDEYRIQGIGQIRKGEQVCTVTIAEFYIVGSASE